MYYFKYNIYKVIIMMPKPGLWHHKNDSSETPGTSICSMSIYRINCNKI